MTPAAFAHIEPIVAIRRNELGLRTVRNSRRWVRSFIGDAQAPLFHAWRP
jgi:hypothetical protein